MRVPLTIAVVGSLLAAGGGVAVFVRSEAVSRPSASPRARVPDAATRSTTTTAPATTTTTSYPLLPGAPAAPVGAGVSVSVPLGPCPADRVTLAITVPTPAVLLGTPVEATARQSNDGDQPCLWPGDIRFVWRDAKGAEFERARSDVQPVSVRWEPGQVLEQHETWDQRFADGTTAAIGLAAVTVGWGPAGAPGNEASTRFLIGLPPAPAPG